MKTITDIKNRMRLKLKKSEHNSPLPHNSPRHLSRHLSQSQDELDEAQDLEDDVVDEQSEQS